MPSEFPYATVANYSPRGVTDKSTNSRKLCAALKRGRTDLVDTVAGILATPDAAALQHFLSDQVSFVPVPRSAPLYQGALWPAMVVCERLHAAGFGQNIVPCIQRTEAVQKSATAGQGNRPTVQTHYDTLAVTQDLFTPTEITLVDDVLSRGATSIGCALRVREAFPNALIRIFAVFRTQGFVDEIDKLADPSIGRITYFENSGKTHRDP